MLPVKMLQSEHSNTLVNLISAYFIDVNLILSFEGLEACSELGHFRKYAWNIGIVAMNTFFF